MVAKASGFDEADADAIVLATQEAASNVIEHAFLPEEDAAFDIVCEASPIRLKVIVRDKGLPFSPEAVKRYSADEVIEGKDPAGLGFFLMEKSVDEFSIHNLGYGGKEVHLVKYVHRRHIESIVATNELIPYDRPEHRQEKPREKIPHRIEPMQPSQAIEISQCAYRTYGYRYVSEDIYYPERITAMNRSGSLVSAVAVTKDTDEVMAHAALEFDAQGDLCELGVAFTKPQFRNQGCLNELADHLLRAAREKGRNGVYARAVTSHPYSQKALARNGFKDCGIILGLAPPTLFNKDADGTKPRESIILSFRSLSEPQAMRLYGPARHREILERIYRDLDVPVTWAEAEDSPPSTGAHEDAVVVATVFGSLSHARIVVQRCGRGLVKEVERNLKELTKRRVDTVNLYLDLGAPETARYAASFEALGFFFAGILPSNTRQNFILQYLNNVPVEYNSISAASERAADMLAYIRTVDPNEEGGGENVENQGR